MTWGEAVALVALVAVGLYALRLRASLRSLNPHAHLLGRVVECRVYEASDWERYIVVAVSWEGAVCVRRESTPKITGRWIPKDKAPERVREVRQ